MHNNHKVITFKKTLSCSFHLLTFVLCIYSQRTLLTRCSHQFVVMFFLPCFFCQLSCFLSVKEVSFAVLLLKMMRLMLSFIFLSPVTFHFPSVYSKKEKAWRRTHFPKVSDKCVETRATFNSCHLSPPSTLSGSIVLVSETVSELFHSQTFT